MICTKAAIGRAKKKGGIYRYKPQFFDFPGVLAQLARHATTGRRTGSACEGDLVRLPPGGADREVPRRGVDPGA